MFRHYATHLGRRRCGIVKKTSEILYKRKTEDFKKYLEIRKQNEYDEF